MIHIEELYKLVSKIDKEASLSGKLTCFKNWISRFPEVFDTRIISFSSSSISDSSDILHTLPPNNLSAFPKEPSVVNGRSAVPKELFPPSLQQQVTLFIPFYIRDEDPAGALLVKCENPKRMLRRDKHQLGLIASKLGDIITVGNLYRGLRESEKIDKKSDSVSPEMLGRLMNYLELPMYVTDRQGEFVSVNRSFLDHFSYSSLEAMIEQGDFFVETDNWSKGIKKLFGEDSAGATMKVRTGKGETRLVKDAATLVGKYTLGVLFDITSYLNWNEALEETLEAQKALNEKLLNATSMLEKTQCTTMKSLARLAEYRDMETGNHLHRICEFNRLLTKGVYESQPYHFHIGEDYVNDIYLSGMLHDIGKVAVPDQILLKPGSLSLDEWDVMKKHTLLGWDILKEADHELGEQSFLTLASRIALSHHERYDGTGYPKKLEGEDIPLSARISAISDVYDALTSKRPYKDAWSHSQAVEEILSQRGTQFDPVLMDIFSDLENEFLRIKSELPDSNILN
jgi:PAS domain-containing protein